ncbi:ATP-dependent helicase [Escherichia coli]
MALSANDPANVWGNLLPWPAHPATLVPTRRAGALVVTAQRIVLSGARWQKNAGLAGKCCARGFPRADYRTASRTTASLTEVNDLPVRQTPMFTLLREAGVSSSPQGLDWG